MEIEKVYSEYLRDLLSYSKYITKCAAASQDIVHDLFVAIIAKSVVLPDDDKARRAYLLTAVHNRSINYMTTAAKINTRSIVGGENEDHAIQDKNCTVENMTANDINREILLAIDTLPERQREAVKLWIDGYTDYEIAENMDISQNTVRAHLKLALPKLREVLKPLYDSILQNQPKKNKKKCTFFSLSLTIFRF